MTLSKKIKLLNNLENKLGPNKILYEVYDDYLDAYNEVKKGEEKPKFGITLGNIIFQLEHKQGIFYEEIVNISYKEFSNYLKWIEFGDVKKLHPLYKESKKLYIKKWEEKNPGLKYEEEMKKIQKQKQQFYKTYLSSLFQPYLYLPFKLKNF